MCLSLKIRSDQLLLSIKPSVYNRSAIREYIQLKQISLNTCMNYLKTLLKHALLTSPIMRCSRKIKINGANPLEGSGLSKGYFNSGQNPCALFSLYLLRFGNLICIYL